jgi:diguanylate cyclase (GGDEF)-like protein/PAS domain S-box-containing protein
MPIKPSVVKFVYSGILMSNIESSNKILKQAAQESRAKMQESEARFHLLTVLSSNWYWEQDDSGNFTALPDRLSYRAGVITDAMQELKASVVARRPFNEYIFGRSEADGARRYFQVSGEPKFDASGRFTGYRGIGKEITERIAEYEDMRCFRLAMEVPAEAIFLTDRASMAFIDINNAACQMFGYTREELIKLDPMTLSGRSRDDMEQVYDNLISSGENGDRVAIDVQRQDGSMLSVEIYRKALDSNGKWIVVSALRDITERKEAERQLLRLANYNVLTGLPNRTLFYSTLQRTLSYAEENHETVSVLCLDLDRFKDVNDTLGHAIGDELLLQFSNRLAHCVRIRDTIGHLGGDEFSLILVMPDGQHTAVVVANQIREILRQPFNLNGHEVSMTASIGITVYPDDALDAETLIKFADTAMHQAKEAGRDTYRFFTMAMNTQVLARLDLEGALRKAIDNEEFILYYQPKIQLNTGRITGVEALMRWNRPGYELVSPGVFIPLLEETGLIVRVGAWVIGAACKQIGEWLRSSIGPVHVSVNVSSRQFVEGDLESEVVRAVGQSNIDSKLLELELTESTLMSNAERTISILQNLKALGVQISIDDFGTGYSSLVYLRRFPIDTIKIDMAFIRDLATNPDDAAITLAIISMAHSLKLNVIAEGVETEEQLAYLRHHNCDQIQGYYFSRPVPVKELERMLREEKKLPVPHLSDARKSQSLALRL